MPAPTNPSLLTWDAVGTRTGLNRTQARKLGEVALTKLKRALVAASLDDDWLFNEFGIVTATEERYLAILLTRIAETRATPNGNNNRS